MWEILESETFSHLISFDGIFIGLDYRSFFFYIYIFQLVPLVLSLGHESLDDLTLCRHQLAELDTLIFEYLHEFIDLELRERRDSVDDSFFLEC